MQPVKTISDLIEARKKCREEIKQLIQLIGSTDMTILLEVLDNYRKKYHGIKRLPDLEIKLMDIVIKQKIVLRAEIDIIEHIIEIKRHITKHKN